MKRTNLLLTLLIIVSSSFATQLLADHSVQTDADFPQTMTIRHIHNATDTDYQLTVANESSNGSEVTYDIETEKGGDVYEQLQTSRDTCVLRTSPLTSTAYRLTWHPFHGGAFIRIEFYDFAMERWKRGRKVQLTYTQDRKPGETFNTNFNIVINKGDYPTLVPVESPESSLGDMPSTDSASRTGRRHDGAFDGIGPSTS